MRNPRSIPGSRLQGLWRRKTTRQDFSALASFSCATLVLLASRVLLGCSPLGSACAAPSCGKGYECLANRCMPAEAEPVPRDAERFVLLPIMLALAGRADATPAPTVTLGSERARRSVLYLRFDDSWKSRSEISAAFLLLTPSAGVEPNPEDVPLEVWTVSTAWSPEAVARGALPGLKRPRAYGLARPSPRALVRVDVTDVARSLARTPDDDGVAVAARSAHGPGVTLLTGTAFGGAPRLEVYLEQPRPLRTAW